MPILAPMLAFAFLGPWLFAAGAAATSVPIVIHLLNKRKFRIVIWAAMDFLLAAQRRNARRLKFQRWLLLAVRCLALLILAMAIGRLVLDSSALAFLGSGQRAIVVVWDDSYSMGYQHGGGTGTTFDESKKLLADWLGKLPVSDKVMLIHARRGGVVQGNKPSPDHERLRAEVNAARVSDAGTDLPAALEQASDALAHLAKDGVQTREVLVLTDFSSSSIHDPVRGMGAENRVEGLEGDRLKKAMDAVKSHATAPPRVIDLGVPDQVNMAVTALRSERPVVTAGAMCAFDVTVMNATHQAQSDVPLTILVDGLVAHTEKLAQIDAGSPRTVSVDVMIPTTGLHQIEARINTDRLPADDARRLMLDVQRKIPVLLVDGSPADDTHLGSTKLLEVAYTGTPDGTPAWAFSTKTITELELPTTTLSQYKVVVLSDTQPPENKLVRDNLKQYVENGGLLMIFPGNDTNARAMNHLLGDAGAKLLPATLGQPVKLTTAAELNQGIHFAPDGFGNAILQPFGEEDKQGKDAGFKSVQTTEYLKLGVPTDGSVETILRYAKPDGTPGDAAIVLKAVGKGKVVLFASTADTRWSSFAGDASYLPIIQRLTYNAMSREAPGLTLRVGDKINLPRAMENPGSWTGPRNSQISVNEQIIDGKARLTGGPLQLAGSYSAADGRPVVVVNPDPEEADIRHVTDGAMASALGIKTGDIIDNPSALAPRAAAGNHKSGGSDLARNLLLAALGFFLLETLLARLFSVYR